MTVRFHQACTRSLLQSAAEASLLAAEFGVGRWPHVKPADRLKAKDTIFGLLTAATVCTDGLDLAVQVRLNEVEKFLKYAPNR